MEFVTCKLDSMLHHGACNAEAGVGRIHPIADARALERPAHNAREVDARNDLRAFRDD